MRSFAESPPSFAPNPSTVPDLIFRAPTFDVMISTVFLKSTRRP